MRCPACGMAEGESVLHRERVPVLQNRVWESAGAGRAASCGSLDIVWCPSCDHLWNAAFDADKLVYDASYDNRQDASPAFAAYMQERAQAVAAHLQPGQTVVEVGCGQGGFLAEVCRISGAAGVGFDPSYRGSGTEGAAHVFARLYDASAAEHAADVVVSRHVIEHIVAPSGLLAGLRAATAGRPEARILFECPDVSWILDGAVLWDFFYEHVHYFSPRSLAALFGRCGFDVLRQSPVFNGQYQWLEAQRGQGSEASLVRDRALGGQAARLQAEEQRWIADTRATWSELGRSGRVALWGAGAKGATLAQIADPDASLLRGVVDLNPAKQGGFLGGTGHEVLAPADLPDHGVSHVIVMNPAYEAEIRRQVCIEGLGVTVQVAQAAA